MASIDELRDKLERYITDQTGSAAKIERMTPLAGGASRDSWMVDIVLDGEPQRLVMRRDFPTSMNDNALTREQEFRLMQRAYESGVSVARMRWLCTDLDVLGLPFFIMDFVEGISIGRKVVQVPELAHARDVLPEQMAAQLAKIHTMQIDDLEFLQRPRTDPITHVIAETYTLLDNLGLHIPAFEFALRWAQRTAPDCTRVTFTHGDFRVGNLLVDPNGLTAVIDWEFAHVGDPREELGYVCMRDWRFGNDHLRMGGLSDRERFIRAYEAHSGVEIDRRAVDWWEVMGNIRWGIICLSQAERHLSGRDPSVELASLGRRSAEMQLEALRMIEQITQHGQLHRAENTDKTGG